MIKQLFANSTILIASLFLLGQLVKNYKLSFPFSFKNKLIVGAIFGFLGIILMQYRIDVSPTVIIDLRHIAIIFAAIYGGAPAALVSALLISLVRISLFSISQASIIASVNMMIIGVICGLLSRWKPEKKELQFFLMNTVSLLMITVTLSILIPDIPLLLQAVGSHWIISMTMGFLAFRTAQYIYNSNELFQKLREQSTTDFLTGLNNTRYFDNLFNEYTQKAKEKEENLSLIVIDIDHFKKINDTYGHLLGDKILKELGMILLKSSRSVDIVSRNGGEEFSILLPNCSHENAREIAERIRGNIERHSFSLSNSTKIQITISAGISSYPETDIERLYDHADKKLYQAKAQGRNQVC